MPPLSLPLLSFDNRAPEIVIPSAGRPIPGLATLQSSGVKNGPLRLRVYRGGCSFGTGCRACARPPDSPDPDRTDL